MARSSIALSDAGEGARARVVAFRGGCDFQRRIMDLGLYIGCEVEVLMSTGGGRMIVAAGDTRVALGHGMAEKVLVREIGAE